MSDGASGQHFTTATYRRMVGILVERGFAFGMFDGLDWAEPVVYLRHDIDLSIRQAHAFAQTEAEHGFRSTYYCMLDNPLYNPATTANRAMLAEIMELGHEVGLHVVAPPSAPSGDLGRWIARDCNLLAAMLERPVRTFSFHRPPAEVLSSEVRVPGLCNAYGPEYFSSDSYISDSNHRWRCGDPVAFVEAFSASRLQILTHPVWFGEASESGETRFRSFWSGFEREARDYLSANVALAGPLLNWDEPSG